MYSMDIFNNLNIHKSLLLFTEMYASLVDAPDFKPACGALILSQIGSIPIHLRQSSHIIIYSLKRLLKNVSPPFFADFGGQSWGSILVKLLT